MLNLPGPITDAPTIASAITFLAVVIQGVVAHTKGRRGRHSDEAIVARITKLIDAHETVDDGRHQEAMRQIELIRGELKLSARRPRRVKRPPPPAS